MDDIKNNGFINNIGEKKRKSLNLPILTILLIFCIIVPFLLWSCSAASNAEAYVGFADSFLKMSLDATRSMDVNIKSNMMGYKDATLKLGKLEQVGKWATEWINLMTATAARELWSPTIAEVTGDLDKYKNDRYEIVKLQFTVERTSTRQYSSVIKVFEVYTNKQYPYDEIFADLKKRVDDLDKLLEAQLEAYKLSYTTTKKVIEQYETWKVAKLSNSTYKVSGPALGWTGSTFTSGIWTYDTSNKSVTAVDAGSVALDKVIKGK